MRGGREEEKQKHELDRKVIDNILFRI